MPYRRFGWLPLKSSVLGYMGERSGAEVKLEELRK